MKKNAIRVSNTAAAGFSLIEVLIVVAIIGILASISVPVYRNYISSSKLGAARTTLEQLPVLLETFRAERGRFPSNNTYTYEEGATGNVISRSIMTGTGITGGAGLVDFRPRTSTVPGGKGILFRYSITITGSNSTSERATFSAIGTREAAGIAATGSYR